MRIAFAGFRHGHIFGLLKKASARPDVQVVAACEDHEPTRKQLAGRDDLTLTHRDYRKMLDEVDCDAVAVGDYYARRGAIAIAALERGRHVISDKPLCTRMDELDRIAELAREKKLSVGLQLDLRDNPKLRTARRLLRDGAIGEVQAVWFTGQHPLLLGSRPGWYFEEGKHGGTINDIAIHGVDAVPWMTGRTLAEVVAARVWNARPEAAPGFQDGAQFMLRMDNGGGVMGDVSYLAPDKSGYALPQYWRFTFHGLKGMIEFNMADKDVRLAACEGPKELQVVPAEGTSALDYFDSFLHESEGRKGELGLTTPEVLQSARNTLAIQRAADERLRDVPLGE